MSPTNLELIVLVLTTMVMPWCFSALGPQIFLETDDLIKGEGYPCEKHHVVTEDGYILSLFRIPKKGNASKGAVLFLHPLFTASDIWLLQGPKKDLAFILSDNGFDVWLGDFRGNVYSRNHTTLSPSNPEFWMFSVHEIGKYDTSAMMDYILKTTGNSKMFAVGESMGVTAFYILMSEKPEYNEKIKLFVGMAPQVLVNVTALSASRKIWLDSARKVMANLGQQNKLEVFTRKGFFKDWSPLIVYAICSELTPTQDICHDLSFLAFGKLSKTISRKVLPTLLSHVPAGTSIFTVNHLLRLINSGEFKPYDMGSEINMVKYGSEHPAQYNLSRVTCPIALYASQNDQVANFEDAKLTALNTPNVIHIRVLETFHHADFILSRFAWRVIYGEILQLFKSKA